MTRLLYNLVWWIAALVLVPAWAVGALLKPRWRRGAAERLGLAPRCSGERPLHVHAASVGEVRAAEPLIKALQERGVGPLLISTSTPEGRQAAAERWGARIPALLFPFDFWPVLQHWLARVEPRLTILVETELWPGMIWAHAAGRIPLALVSGRVSDRSFPRYRLLRPLLKGLLERFDLLAVQTPQHAQRLIRIGAPPSRVRVLGNVKFDRRPSADERPEAARIVAQLKAGGRLILGASTHEGEEAACGRALLAARGRGVECRLLIAPRHMERCRAARRDLEALGLRVGLRSLGLNAALPDALILDSVGELSALIGLADVCFVGGSLARVGGHNVLEPAALGVPVIVGPHTRNFVAEVRSLIEAGALLRVGDAVELARACVELFESEQRRGEMGAAGLRAFRAGQGAVQRTLDALDGLWPELMEGEK